MIGVLSSIKERHCRNYCNVVKVDVRNKHTDLPFCLNYVTGVYRDVKEFTLCFNNILGNFF